MVRRSQLEIFIDILRAVAEGKKKPTHIMYRANLSWTRLKKHLDFLVSQDLLLEKVDDGATVFALTPKGKDVIVYFKRIEVEIFNTKKSVPEVYIHTSL